MMSLYRFAQLSPFICATALGDPIWPAHLNINDQIENVKEAGCSGLCSWNGFVDGYVIGTAPWCAASCDADCPGRACISYIPGDVKGFMPDAGDLCLDMPLEAAYEVFKDRNDTLLQKFKDLMMTVKGKACCCQTPLPRKDSFVKKDAPTEKGTTSCDDWCQGGGFGHGVTIGTAPVCEASCASDCPGQVCSASNDFFSDHGNGCATGEKVCCCAKSAPEKSVANAWKYTTEMMDAPTYLGDTFSCADLCDSGGFGGGHMSGTAPSCGGSCDDCDGQCFHVSSGDVTDYGHGCWTGSKVCCCDDYKTTRETVI